MERWNIRKYNRFGHNGWEEIQPGCWERMGSNNNGVKGTTMERARNAQPKEIQKQKGVQTIKEMKSTSKQEKRHSCHKRVLNTKYIMVCVTEEWYCLNQLTIRQPHNQLIILQSHDLTTRMNDSIGGISQDNYSGLSWPPLEHWFKLTTTARQTQQKSWQQDNLIHDAYSKKWRSKNNRNTNSRTRQTAITQIYRPQ